MKQQKIYKVYCEYYVKAVDEKTVETFINDEDNFAEAHLIIEEATLEELKNNPDMYEAEEGL